MLVFAWQVQHFNALSLVAVLARFCFQSLAAVKNIACGGVWVSLMPGYTIKTQSLVAVRCCDWCILGCRAGPMRKEATWRMCQVVMLFTRLCGCCCKHEFCCAVGCAAALARKVAQIRMMHVCLDIERAGPCYADMRLLRRNMRNCC